MPTYAKVILSVAAGVSLLSSVSPISAQATQDPTELPRRIVRHFPEKPPVQFEILQTLDHQPRMVITNLHQYPLTAFIVRTDPTAPNSITNTLMFDALTHTGLLAPIPRGLSLVIGVPHAVGLSVPDPVLAAVVWEDGSTYGPDELLVRIPKARSALADSYDRAIALLQSGLDKNWTAAEYSAAARQLRPPIDPAQPALPEPTVAARPENYHVRAPSTAKLREVFRLETERWISNDWVVQYRGHFLQLKPQNKRYGPTQAKALVCEWEDVEVHYRGERMDYEDLVVRPQAVQVAAREPSREPAKHVESKPAPGHPWRQGYEQRMKLQRLNGSQESALVGVSASATP
jgi:hypothetical protein